MKLYRSREGKILGVCQGIADATGFSVRYIRIALILIAFFTSGWILAAYFIAALFLPLKRPEGYESAGFKENFEDLREDTEAFVKREYSELKNSGPKSKRSPKEPKAKKASAKKTPKKTKESDPIETDEVKPEEG